jgi:hypothetical protein
MATLHYTHCLSVCLSVTHKQSHTNEHLTHQTAPFHEDSHMGIIEM